MSLLTQILYLSNQITMLRLVLIPFVILAILYGRFDAAFYLVLAAGLTDGIDGVLARRLGQQSTLGRYLDPIADKLLLNSCLIALTVIGEIPLWLTIMFFSRDVIILMTSLVLILATTRGIIPPSLSGKATTVATVVTVLLTLIEHIVTTDFLPIAQHMGIYITALLTIVSGLQYAWRTAERLRTPEPSPAAAPASTGQQDASSAAITPLAGRSVARGQNQLD